MNTTEISRNRGAYIARYTLNHDGTDLVEQILHRADYCTAELRAKWDALVLERISRITGRYSTEPMLQLWYFDEHAVSLEATTNQPFKLP